MRLKDLESALSGVDRFEEPKFELEQYNTSAQLAAHMLFAIESTYGDIEDKVVADFGCGTGVLAIGAQILGSGFTIGLDIDDDALAIARRNVDDFEVDVDFVRCNLGGDDPLPVKSGLVDTVIMNPPFGTRVKGVDMLFVKRALDLCTGAVYSLHKTSTRGHIAKKAAEWGVDGEVLAEMRFDIPKMYKFHKKKSADVEVDFWRLAHRPTKDGDGDGGVDVEGTGAASGAGSGAGTGAGAGAGDGSSSRSASGREHAGRAGSGRSRGGGRRGRR